MKRILAGILITLALVSTGQGEAKAEQVHCYDPAREVLSYIGREACEHEIVSSERAQEIRDARRAYIQRSMRGGTASKDPLPDPLPNRQKIRSYGTGFFVDASGYVVTNHHVVAKCGGLSLLVDGGRSVGAILIAASPGEDLALLKAKERAPSPARLARGRPSAGAPLSIIGFPVLKLPRREPKTVSGEYLGEHALPHGGAVLMIGARVWPGSSGSPALDRSGRVVGVVFAKANIPGIFQKSGEVVDDRAYAVPTSMLSAFLTRNGVSPQSGGTATGSAPRPEQFLVRVDCLR